MECEVIGTCSTLFRPGQRVIDLELKNASTKKLDEMLGIFVRTINGLASQRQPLKREVVCGYHSGQCLQIGKRRINEKKITVVGFFCSKRCNFDIRKLLSN